MMFVKLRFFWLLAIALLGCDNADKSKLASDTDDYGEYEIVEAPAAKAEIRTHIVEIRQMKFVPDILNVNRGDTVVWINRDLVDHDVTEKSQHLWTSERMPAGASWKLAVTESQVYFCSLHVVMGGKIIVDRKEISMISASPEITLCK